MKRVVEDVMISSQSSTTIHDIQGSSMSAHSSTNTDQIDSAEQSVKGNEMPTPKQHATDIKDNNVAKWNPYTYVIHSSSKATL